MTPQRTLLLGLAVTTTLLAAGCLSASGAVAPDPTTPSPAAALGAASFTNGDTITYEMDGTGWAARDITATEPLSLTYTLTHDTMDDLCVFSHDGDGVYDQGHHSVVLMWKVGSDPLYDGHWWLWTGTPYNAFWPRQSGECGVSESLELTAGETARVVVATSVAGFHLDVSSGDGVALHETVTLAARSGHEHERPQPSGIAASQTPATVAAGREWRATFDLDGPALIFTDAWRHSSDGLLLDTAAYARAALLNVDFDGADAYEPVPHGLPAYPTWGAGYGISNDGASLFPAYARSGGPVEAYVQQHVAVAAHTGGFDQGADMLSVPLGP